jgi:GTP-binding protein HflX
LSQEDLTDLGYLRLDLIGLLSVPQSGTPGTLYLAHLLPPNETGRLCEILKPTPLQDCPIVFDQFIKDLETDLQEALKHHAVTSGSESAMLVSASSHGRAEQEERLTELADLAASVGVTVIDKIAQRIGDGHQRYLLGSGKLKEVLIQTLHKGADMVILIKRSPPPGTGDRRDDRHQNHRPDPVDSRHFCAVPIAVKARSSGTGAITLSASAPSGQGTQLSRLSGGSEPEARETKLETDRRKIRDRITHLEREIEQFSKHQDQRRARRERQGLPVLSFVGYTNAGNRRY